MRRPLFGLRVGTRRQDSQIAIGLLAVGIYDGSSKRARDL